MKWGISLVRRPLGDLALPFRMFEQTMYAIQTDDLEWEDGYRKPDKSYNKPFKGILVDRKEDIAEMQGVRPMAERLLYIRLSQDWYPNLVEGDIVIDSLEDQWKVIERFDYSSYANTMVFGVARVDI